MTPPNSMRFSPVVAGLGLRCFLVGDDADGGAADARVSADEGAAVVGIVLVEFAAVDDAGDEFVHVVDVARLLPGRDRGGAVEVVRRVFGRVFCGVESRLG